MAMEEFWIFVRKNSRNISKWMSLSVVLNTVYNALAHFTIYNTKHNPPKIIKHIIKKALSIIIGF